MTSERTIKTIALIAGETSGDIHGAAVIESLKKHIPQAVLFGIGGDMMRQQGMDILFHVNKMAILGFTEVVKHLPFIQKVFRTLLNEVAVRKPDAVVLIDYPGFNIRLAKKIRSRFGTNIKIMYYISPQVWAWKKNRIEIIAKSVDVMVVVFEFEVELYKSTGMNVEFVGHPLLDVVKPANSCDKFFRKYGLDPEKPVITLLPGSRNQEIIRHLPPLLEAMEKVSADKNSVQILIGKAPHIDKSVYTGFLKAKDKPPLLVNEVYDCMFHSTAVVVSSGTATLETGIAGTPMVIVYKMSQLTYALAKRMVSLPYIGMVNIIHNRNVVPELIQHDASPDKISHELNRFLSDTSYYNDVKSTLNTTSSLLGEPGASGRAADTLIKLLA